MMAGKVGSAIRILSQKLKGQVLSLDRPVLPIILTIPVLTIIPVIPIISVLPTIPVYLQYHVLLTLYILF